MDVISPSSHFSGDFSFGNFTRVEGKLDGSIKSSGLFVVGQQAHITADIAGSTVVINGKIDGNITAEESITIEKNGHVTGNIKAPAIIIKYGGKINGTVSMSKYHEDFRSLYTP